MASTPKHWKARHVDPHHWKVKKSRIMIGTRRLGMDKRRLSCLRPWLSNRKGPCTVELRFASSSLRDCENLLVSDWVTTPHKEFFFGPTRVSVSLNLFQYGHRKVWENYSSIQLVTIRSLAIQRWLFVGHRSSQRQQLKKIRFQHGINL
jgi:hypothetical protein